MHSSSSTATGVASFPADFRWGGGNGGVSDRRRRPRRRPRPANPGHVFAQIGASYDDYVDPNGEIVNSERVGYLSGYFAAAARAIADGIDLRGYFVWSFLDNYEWAEGYSKRFGIVYVDYRTQDRIAKRSGYWYRDLISQHASISKHASPTHLTASVL